MNPKQDRPGARTPEDLERKYNFGENFHEIKESIKKQNIQLDKQNLLFGNYVTENDKAVSKLEQGLSVAEENVKTVKKDMYDVLMQIAKMQKSFESFMTSTNDSLKHYWETVYPVGSIYISVSGDDPGTLFGGTWEQMKDRFLLSAGDTYVAGATGGEAEHTLTVEEMPNHRHTSANGTQNKSGRIGYYDGTKNAGQDFYVNYGYVSDRTDLNIYVEPEGGSKAHNNMPPYIVVYVWKRTA